MQLRRAYYASENAFKQRDAAQQFSGSVKPHSFVADIAWQSQWISIALILGRSLIPE